MPYNYTIAVAITACSVSFDSSTAVLPLEKPVSKEPHELFNDMFYLCASHFCFGCWASSLVEDMFLLSVLPDSAFRLQLCMPHSYC